MRLRLCVVIWSWPDVAEVVELFFGPCRLDTRGALLSARYIGKKLLQMAFEQFATSWVLVGVGCTELGVPALSALGEDFGDWRLAISFLMAVDSCLLPALLGF